MLVDKCLTWRNIASHKDLCHIRSHAGIFDLHTFHHPGFRIQSRLPQLLGVHLSQTFISLKGKTSRFMAPAVFLQGLVIVKIFLLSLLGHYFIKRRHGNVYMSLIDQFRHKTVE